SAAVPTMGAASCCFRCRAWHAAACHRLADHVVKEERKDEDERRLQQRESQGRAELLRRAPAELASEKESRPDGADAEQKEQKHEAAPHAIARGRSSGGLEIPATAGADKRDFPPDKHASGPSRGGGTALPCAAMSLDPRHKSRTLLDGRDRAPARSYLKAIGFSDADLTRPIVGIANTWTETMPCNFNLRRLAEQVKRGVREAGGTPMEFNTIAISDGITMGTEGMKTSLVSREVIADSIELVARGHMFDALVVLVGCDMTIPGGAMALLRVDVPGFVVYGGSIQPGRFRGRDVTIQDLFEAVGANAAGKMSDGDLKELEDVVCPGA